MATHLLPLYRTLLLLVLATGAALWLRSDDLVGLAVAGTTLAISWPKGRRDVLDFMELRDAPLLWRGLAEGWLALFSALLFVFYAVGRISGP